MFPFFALWSRDGYNSWRDWLKPTQILSHLCQEHNIDGPYFLAGHARVGGTHFTPDMAFLTANQHMCDNEILALYVLRNWKRMPRVGCELVPEHVETRPLYRPDKPGIAQGHLQLWIDMFAMNLAGAVKPPVVVAPRKSKR